MTKEFDEKNMAKSRMVCDAEPTDVLKVHETVREYECSNAGCRESRCGRTISRSAPAAEGGSSMPTNSERREIA